MYRSIIRAKDTTLNFDGVKVELTRKRVKNINLRISRSCGTVKVSAPLTVPEAYILDFIQSKLPWIKERKQLAEQRNAVTEKQYCEAEHHDYLGEQYLLSIKVSTKKRVFFDGCSIRLYCPSNSDSKDREAVLESWYRQQLKTILPDIVNKYSSMMGISINEFRIKKMKTKWGTCNITDKRIWINLELIKYPIECLEYVVLHELAHLFERHHNARFYKIVETYMPNWKLWDAHLDHN